MKKHSLGEKEANATQVGSYTRIQSIDEMREREYRTPVENCLLGKLSSRFVMANWLA